MRRAFIGLLIILSSLSLTAASINGGSEVRPDLFYSLEELEKEDFSAPLTAEERAYYDSVDIYLLTASPAEPVYIYFGHSGIVIDPPDADAVMYDWGTFGFSDGFYLNFTMGLLYYSISSGWAEQRMMGFIADDRTVTLLPLDLTAEAKSAVMRFCSRNMLPENRTYLYHYYKDNCATRVRDLYDEATGCTFGEWALAKDTGRSFREWAMLYLSPSLFFEYLLNYLQGPEIDEDLTLYEACFLPEVLEDAISEFEGRESEVVYHTRGRSPVPESYSLTLRSILIGLAFAIPPMLTLSKRRWLRRAGDTITAAIELFLGIMSAVLLFMMTVTNHDVTYWNINPLIISPLMLVSAALHLVSLGRRERRNGLFRITLVESAMLMAALAFQIITPFHQGNAPDYISASILYAAEVLSARYGCRRSR